jgi:hypothetical protein
VFWVLVFVRDSVIVFELTLCELMLDPTMDE